MAVLETEAPGIEAQVASASGPIVEAREVRKTYDTGAVRVDLVPQVCRLGGTQVGGQADT